MKSFILFAFLIFLGFCEAIHKIDLYKSTRTLEEGDAYVKQYHLRRQGLLPPRQTRYSTLSRLDQAVVPTVPMLNVGDTAWIANITMGEPAQGPFRVIMDTGSSNLWIPSVKCDLKFDTGCAGKHKYDHDKSRSFRADACEVMFIPYGTGFVIGYISNDTVHVGPINVKNQQFGEALYMADFFSSFPIDGILGLAYPLIAVDKVLPVFDQMMEQKLVAKDEFSVFLSNDVGGENSAILFGGIDDKYYKGNFTYVDVEIPSYWLVAMANIKVDGKVVEHCLLDNCLVVVDTGTSVIVAPPFELSKMLAAIGKVEPDCSNVDKLPTISFNLGGVDLPLTPEFYVLKVETKNGTQCILGIEESIAVTPLFILGDPFLRAYYTIFDRANTRVGFAPSVQSKIIV